jgi:hypothetical protein
MPFQSEKKVAEVKEKLDEVNEDLTKRSNEFKVMGIDQNTRQLIKTAENEVVSAYYGLIKHVKDNNLSSLIEKKTHQIYTGIYHSLVNPREPIFNASQTIKEVFSTDVKKKSNGLIRKIELISSTNRKVAQRVDPQNIASISHTTFKNSENNVRLAFREIIDSIVNDVKGIIA